MSIGFLVAVAAVWMIFLGVWFIVSRVFRNADADRMRKRILERPDGKAAKEKGAVKSPKLLMTEEGQGGRIVTRLLERLRLQGRLESMLEQAGLKWRPRRVLHAAQILFVVFFLIVRLLLVPQYLVVQLFAGVVGASLPFLKILRARARRMRKFEEQFPESLEFVARSMRAGHAFSVSLEMLHREFQEPLSGEFRRTFDEHNLGLPLDQALLKLAKRVPMLDVHFFVSAVLLQKRTGGNLAEILDKLAYVIRERFKLRGKIRAISAHGRMTGTALTLIPVVVALLMFYVNPQYVSFFIEDETGNIMVGVAVALQLIGYAVIQKIVAIEV